MPFELWIDADDTLWENNVFFEHAFDDFIDFLNHSTLTARQVRDFLDEIEHMNNRVHGYGAHNFARNLEQCFERLSERGASVSDRAHIQRFGHKLAQHPIELLEGVEDTLAYLAERHVLLLCTKGDPIEQRGKLERSGLVHFFHHVRILREKDAIAYRDLLVERSASLDQTWMIGNSPKSDINPPLEIGMRAVYVPHPRTWHLEHQPVPREHDRLLVLERFANLQDHF